MGIESDQLVYDYLSRVGDLAQQRHLSAGDRARLVSTLRDEIDRRRATQPEETPAAVRGILGALGTPAEVVDRAGAPGDAGNPETPRGPLPRPGGGRPPRGTETGTRTGRSGGTPTDGGSDRDGGPARGDRTGRDGRTSRDGSAPAAGARRDGSAPGGPGIPAPRPGVSAPDRPLFHGGTERAAFDGAEGPEGPDWWRTEEVTDGVPGFFGGVERPDLFRPPVPEGDEEDGEEEAEGSAPGKRRRLARLLRPRRTAPAPAPGTEAPVAAVPARPRLANPFVLLAALLLLGGAVFGSLLALAGGWLLAYASRRLTPGEVKGAVLVIPGLAAGSGILWLWGRVQGRWGAPVTPGGEAMGAAVAETWPWVLRGAAVASALFLLWRSRKH
ncbi:hypothetical protein [Streptomyces sp. cmx-4-25]|uniref:hypothetical protein n=1 Tax=Streptomyces sp. cmx-4-25 TaxID=2790933 RepID=UPI003980886F